MKNAFLVILLSHICFFAFAQSSLNEAERDSLRQRKKEIKEVKKMMKAYRKTGVIPVTEVREPYLEKAESLPKTTVKWEEEIYDFKKIKEGDEVVHVFSFTNTGKKDLYITNVKPSCGCTIPSWPSQAIRPGEKGEITVRFNSLGKMGIQNKVITVIGNFEENVRFPLKITGEVIPEVDFEEEKPAEQNQKRQ